MTNNWHNSLERLTRYRLSKLMIGDALVSDELDFRVDCIEDETRLGEKLYIVSSEGKELIRRKKMDSIIDYLKKSNSLRELRIAVNGAFHLMPKGRLDEIDFLGYFPNYDANLASKENKNSRNLDYGIDAFINHMIEKMRFVIQETQSIWQRQP